MRFQDNEHRETRTGFPFALELYVEIVDRTGVHVRSNRRGSIDSKQPPILNHLGIEKDIWLTMSLECEKNFK